MIHYRQNIAFLLFALAYITLCCCGGIGIWAIIRTNGLQDFSHLPLAATEFMVLIGGTFTSSSAFFYCGCQVEGFVDNRKAHATP